MPHMKISEKRIVQKVCIRFLSRANRELCSGIRTKLKRTDDLRQKKLLKG